jgi:hypothetical protein
MTIQILRLKDGADVISETENHRDMIELIMPMEFTLVNQNLVLQHWLPLAAMKGNSVKLPREEIVCFMEPNEHFEKYYLTAVQKVSAVLDEEFEEEEELLAAMDELENSKGISIH